MSDYVSIPQHILKIKTVKVTFDIMFVNKILFVVSLGKKCEVHHNRKRGGLEGGYLVKSPL